jgi:hypothetical protein
MDGAFYSIYDFKFIFLFCFVLFCYVMLCYVMLCYVNFLIVAVERKRCASLMVRAGNLPSGSVCPSAIDAYHKSTVVSHDVGSAPSGAFHWWDIGQYGHVAMATENGWAMMASCHITESWGDCIGTTPVNTYSSTTGAKYLGWSYDYDKSEIADVHKPVPPSPTIPRSATQDNGVPDSNYYARQQIYVRDLHCLVFIKVI